MFGVKIKRDLNTWTMRWINYGGEGEMDMKYSLLKYFPIVGIILVILTLNSCSITETEMAATEEGSTPTVQLVTITKTDMPSTTISPEPTSTRFPYISSTTGKQVLSDFIKNNGGCKLPCLWGITPGISTKSDVQKLKDFFKSGASDIVDENDSVEVNSSFVMNPPKSILKVTFWENRLYISYTLKFIFSGESITKQIVLTSISYKVISESPENVTVKVFGDPFYTEMTSFFSIERILNIYGLPEEILVHAYPDDINHPSPPARYPFNFLLYYPDQNSIFVYTALRENEERNYSGCPENSQVLITVWDPSDQYSIDEAVTEIDDADGFSPAWMKYFLPVQEATDMDVASFYEIFKNGTASCVTTPQDKWPIVE
jgi:hypothetical protein